MVCVLVWSCGTGKQRAKIRPRVVYVRVTLLQTGPDDASAQVIDTPLLEIRAVAVQTAVWSPNNQTTNERDNGLWWAQTV